MAAIRSALIVEDNELLRPVLAEPFLTADQRVGSITFVARSKVIILGPSELRSAAERFRQMAVDGDDMRLREALLQTAEEFEDEAGRAEADVVSG